MIYEIQYKNDEGKYVVAKNEHGHPARFTSTKTARRWWANHWMEHISAHPPAAILVKIEEAMPEPKPIRYTSVDSLIMALIEARRALCAVRELAIEVEDSLIMTQYEDGGFIHDWILPAVDHELFSALDEKCFNQIMQPMSIRSMHKKHKVK